MRNNFHRLTSMLIIGLLVAHLGLFGCASEKKVVKTTVETPSGTERVIEKEVVVEEEPAEDVSILGTTFNFIGEVLAFPFDLIGGVFRAIF